MNHPGEPRLRPHIERAIQARGATSSPELPPDEDILCSDPACVSRRWKHSHCEGWPEHPSYKGL